MSFQQDGLTLNPDAILDLFELTTNTNFQVFDADGNLTSTNIIRWSNYEQVGGTPILLGGNNYSPWPILASGYKNEMRGVLPTLTIRIADYRSTITALLERNRPYNARLTRRRISVRHIDTGPEPNSAFQYRPQKFYLNSWDLDLIVTLKFVNPLARLNTDIPRRRIASL